MEVVYSPVDGYPSIVNGYDGQQHCRLPVYCGVNRQTANVDVVMYTVYVLDAVQMPTYRRMRWPLSTPCFRGPVSTDER